jgi:WD40 repeat protein
MRQYCALCVWDSNTIVLSAAGNSLCVLDLKTGNKRDVTTNLTADTGIISMKRISENSCRLLILYYQRLESYGFFTGSAPRSLSIFNMKTKSVETVIYEGYTKNPGMPVYYTIQGKLLYQLLDNQVCMYDLDKS